MNTIYDDVIEEFALPESELYLKESDLVEGTKFILFKKCYLATVYRVPITAYLKENRGTGSSGERIIVLHTEKCDARMSVFFQSEGYSNSQKDSDFLIGRYHYTKILKGGSDLYRNYLVYRISSRHVLGMKFLGDSRI